MIRRALVLCAGALLGSCAPRANTAIVLDVASDIDPVLLRRVRLEVRWMDNNQAAVRERSYTLREDGTRGVLHTFPASLVVAPDGATDGREAEFSLLAMTDGATAGSEEVFTVSRVRARFRTGQTLRVPVFLAELCGETSVGRLCSAAQTCVADPLARCVDTPSVDTTTYAPPDASDMDASRTLRRLTGVVELRAADERTCAKLREGRWLCWGEGSLGQLGNRRPEDTSLPVSMNLGLIPTDVELGRCHGCTRGDDSSLWCFGCNGSAQVSPTRSLFELAPVRVGSSTWQSVSAGLDFTCAIRASDGRVFCWGTNGSRQLGPTSTGASSAVPVEVAIAPEERFVSVSAGSTHACAVSEAGVAYCWGSNEHFECSTSSDTMRVYDRSHFSDNPASGDGGVSDPLSGVLHNVQSISCGNQLSCAVLRSGAALCWGAAGINGSAITLQFPGPFTVRSARGAIFVRSLSTRGENSVAIDTDGRAMCWGSNAFGQCGVAPPARALGAVELTFARPVVSIVSGATHVCALLDDSTVQCLGGNSAGQLGDGTRSSTPTITPQLVLTDR